MTRRNADSNTANGSGSTQSRREMSADQALLRTLPSVDELARHLETETPALALGHDALIRAARAVIEESRRSIRAGHRAASLDDLVAQLRERLTTAQTPQLRPVINATGVIVNTNLGRAPLAEAAIAAVASVARGYSNLEYDLDAGERGSRHAHVRELLRTLTGAEDALAVNNNAAALLVVLSALASGRDVIVSRGELVEIGGGFRVPEVMRQGGARLVEVGTTNRTRIADYEAAITPETGAILAVHPSNFRIVGFTEAPTLADLARIAHARSIPLVYDLGSGCPLPTESFGVAHEPTPLESIRAGADVVCFSGDKLLGGPQAGLIVGAGSLLATIARHPLMRAVRIDKLTLAALEATLRIHRDGLAQRDLPVWQAIAQPLDAIGERAQRWVAFLADIGVSAGVEPGETSIGGGSLPGETLPTMLCAIDGFTRAHGDESFDAAALARSLRMATTPVVGRVYRDRLYLDPRTVAPREDASLLATLREVFASA